MSFSPLTFNLQDCPPKTFQPEASSPCLRERYDHVDNLTQVGWIAYRTYFYDLVDRAGGGASAMFSPHCHQENKITRIYRSWSHVFASYQGS